MAEDRYAFFRKLSLFTEEDHQPFTWEGDGRGAAVLVHGFPGTPRDVRPLAQVLHAEGWTVTAPLLPGFGPDIATLPERRFREWVDAVCGAFQATERDHERLVLVGHSLGAAVGIIAHSETRPAKQVLLAPYWRFGGPVRHAVWPLLRLWARKWRPLARANFEDQRIRIGIRRILPDIDLDDLVVQEALRDFVVPTRLLDELRGLGVAARKAARRASAPTLVLQGLRDGLVQPRDSDALARTMPNAEIELLDGTHNLTSPTDGAWDRVRASTLRFLNGA
jgi:carboxylesterase